MRCLLSLFVPCVVLFVVAGCNRYESSKSPSAPAAQPAVKTEPPPESVEDESSPAEPEGLKPPPATEQARFAGPLAGASVVRTRIFGDYKPLASLFMGERANRYGRPYYHQGVDILAPVGTKLVAPDDGTVVMAGMLHPTGYGRVTLIRVRVGRSNLYVLYAHLSKVLVRKDERVRRGQVVALSGRSGNAAGLPDAEAHVHVEIRTQEKVKSGLDGRIDPLKYFTETTVPKTP